MFEAQWEKWILKRAKIEQEKCNEWEDKLMLKRKSSFSFVHITFISTSPDWMIKLSIKSTFYWRKKLIFHVDKIENWQTKHIQKIKQTKRSCQIRLTFRSSVSTIKWLFCIVIVITEPFAPLWLTLFCPFVFDVVSALVSSVSLLRLIEYPDSVDFN